MTFKFSYRNCALVAATCALPFIAHATDVGGIISQDPNSIAEVAATVQDTAAPASKPGDQVLLAQANQGRVTPAVPNGARGTSGNQSESRQLEEIEVVAQATRSGVPISETPQSVTVVTREMLDQQDIQSLQEVFRYIPSVQGELSGRTGFDTFSIRGFDQSAYEYRDGLRLDPQGSQQQEPFGIESVEVLKGPLSVLYGEITPGGLVNMTSKLPTAERLIDLEVGAGSYGAYDAAVDVGGPIDDEGQWEFRAPFIIRHNDDPVKQVYSRREFAAPAVKWQPSPNTSLTLLTLVQHDTLVRADPLPVAGTIAPNPNGPIPLSTYWGQPSLGPIEVPQYQLGYLFEQIITNTWTFRQKLKYVNYTQDGQELYSTGLEADDRTLDRLTFPIVSHVRTTSIDNQIENVFRTDNIESRLLLGVGYLDTAQHLTLQTYQLASVNIYAPAYGGPVTYIPGGDANYREVDTQWNPYLQYRLTVDGRYVLVTGLGYGADKDDTADFIGMTRALEYNHKVTGNAALMYLAPSGFSPYVSYSQSFEPQIGASPTALGALPLPELGTQYEAGVKWVAADRRLDLTFAAFNITLTNIAETYCDTSGCFSQVVGEERHRGLELETASKPSDFLELRVSYSYLDAKITQSTIGLAGLTPTNVPRDTAAAFAILDGAAFGIPGGDVSAGLRYAGERRGYGVSDEIPGYVLADVGARYRFNGYTFSLNGKNIFNRTYFSGAHSDGVYPGMPRTIAVNISKHF